MQRKRNEVSMLRSFSIAVAAPASVVSIALIVTLVLSGIYVKSGNRVILYVLIGIFILLMVLYISIAFLVIKRLRVSFYIGLYETTRNNLKAIREGVKDIKEYPKTNIKELNELNQEVEIINNKFENSIIVSNAPNYSSLNLHYVDKERGVVEFESFKNQLSNIIFLSQSFRNAFIDANFISTLSKEQEETLLKICEEVFAPYKNKLFTFRDSHRSLIIYLPDISSFRRIEEQIMTIIREASISTKEVTGTVNIPIKFSIVSYPYSDVDEIFSDLRYAKRQGKTINFYLPNRLKTNHEYENVLTNSMNINYLNKIVMSLSALNYDSLHVEHDHEIITKALDDVSAYLSIDEVAIILYDDILLKYKRVAKNTNGKINNDEVESNYVDVIKENIDDDGSYYFSNPSMANNSLSRFINILHFHSGFFYLLKNEDRIIGLVSFYNYSRDMVLDSYMRESLYVLAMRLEHYYKELARIEQVDFYRSETEYVLSLSKYSLYRVGDNMRISYFSKDLKSKFNNLKVGSYCYKAMYGLDKMCHDCPMRTFKKKNINLGNEKYQISLTLNDRKSHNRNILIEKVDKGDVRDDLFDGNLLINTYYSLMINIRNSYHINGRGYVMLLKFDNMESLIEKQGSEGYLFVIRSFLKKLKTKLQTEEFYSYTPNTVALLMHGVGHVDVINTAEKIYEISKEHFFDDGTNNDVLNITYLPLSWPRGYATSDDFLRHVEDYFYRGKYEINKDFIYFSDQSIARSASKRAFMLAVIEQEFSTGHFSSVSLQPIVRAKDKRIFGAEILLRINNVYSNAVFNAEEISHIAEQEGKTSLITESIINFIGDMYKEYGNNIFKINALQRICINIDSTYLKDASLMKGITALNDTYAFPKGFLSFEIPEEIIPQYTEEIKGLIKGLASANIMLSVDRYTGKYVGLEKIKEIGFKEIKLTRDLVGKIDTDPVRYEEVRDIVNQAKEIGVSVAVVGVENSAQFTILKELDENMMMQGFHFYRPLSRADFISALISHNRDY